MRPSKVNVTKSDGNYSDSPASCSLLHCLYATQMHQSAYWIRGLHITYAPEGNDFLAYRSWIAVW